MTTLAGVRAVRYIGVQPKKLWEVGSRNIPMIHRGDIVIVGETVAMSLCRNRFFEPVNAPVTVEIEPLEELLVDENPPADLGGFTDKQLDTAFDAPLSEEAKALAEAEEAKALAEAAVVKEEAEALAAQEALAAAEANVTKAKRAKAN